MITQFLKKEQFFIYGIALASIVAALVFNTPSLAMWVGFGLAGYSAISNDSIQTLGTFLNTNKKRPWWVLWLFIGGILVITLAYGQWTSNIHFDRLEKIPQPESFQYLQLLSPIVLIILTRFKMPVSTSFLLLSTFSNAKTIQGMLSKTLLGYVLAFVVAYIFWFVTAKWARKFLKNHKTVGMKWVIFQWVTTGFLWSQWLMQDSANIAVFIPRELTTYQFIGVAVFMFMIIGFIMWQRGGSIQEVVTEKKDINNIRSATIIDLIYAFILLYFKQLNNMPMSTTWVFLGLLAGRELALTERSEGDHQPYKRSLKLVGKDILRAGAGLGASLALALIINNQL